MRKAVFLLHGFATDNTDFANLIPYLTEKYDYIQNENLPGHTNKHGLKGFTMPATLGYVTRIIEELINNYDEVDIIGFSMGGALAAYLASNYKIHKLVLLAPADIYINAKYPLVRIKKYFEYLITKHNKNKNGIDRILSMEDYNSVLLEEADAVKITKKYILPNYNLRTIKEFMSTIKFCKENTGEIKNETLIIMGDLDQLVSEKSGEFIKDRCNNAKIVTFENVSHMMLRSRRYRAIIKEIMSFLF